MTVDNEEETGHEPLLGTRDIETTAVYPIIHSIRRDIIVSII